MKLFTLWGELALRGVEEAQEQIQDTTDTAENSGEKMMAAFKKIGGAVATYFTVSQIKQFGQALVETSAEVSAEVSAFEQIMGDYSNTAREKMSSIADATGVVDTRLTGYMTSLTAKFKGLGYDIDVATTLASDGLMLASDAAAFWDKSLDDSMGALNSFINGSYEGGEAIGLFANDTQMAAYAVTQGVVEETKAWAALDEATKQATRLEYAQAMFAQSGATGQAAKEADQYANSTANLAEKWRQFMSIAGEPLLQNVVTPVIQVLSLGVDKLTGFVVKLTEGWSEGDDIVTVAVNTYNAMIEKLEAAATWIKENETAVMLLGIAIGTLTAAVTAYNIVQAIQRAGGLAAITEMGILTVQVYALDVAQKIATVSTAAFGAAVNFLTSPITLVILAIGSLIAIGVLLYKNWDTIKEKASQMVENLKAKFDNLKTAVTTKFDNIKNSIADKINWARDKVRSAIEAIKGFFNFNWSLPKLKMPHVSITGSFSLVPPSVPKFAISWYKKAMDEPVILNSPTLFGAQGGKLLGAGEAGAEVVAGRDTLMSMIREAARGNNAELLATLKNIYALLITMSKNMGHPIMLDYGVLVGELLGGIDDGLGNEAILKARGVK